MKIIKIYLICTLSQDRLSAIRYLDMGLFNILYFMAYLTFATLSEQSSSTASCVGRRPDETEQAKPRPNSYLMLSFVDLKHEPATC